MISNRIKQLRELLNLSQKDLGAETDTPRTTIAGYEQGAALPSYTFLLALNTKFNANIMWLLKGEGDPFLQEKKEPPKPAILQELEKMAKEAAKETIEEQEQELIRLKVQLENLLQENEYLKQEARLAKIEDRQQALETLYEEMYDFYYNTPKDNKPRRIIQRGMGAKGIITEKTGILYPDGTFIEDAETVQEASPAYTADYKEPEEVIELPLVLSLAAGIPIEAVDINETYPVPKRLIKKNKKYCVAKIKGSSMTEAGIKDGSYVLLEYCNEPVNGKIMVVRYGANTTLKLLHLTETGDWQLLYQNGSGAIIPLKTGDWEVKGKFIAVL